MRNRLASRPVSIVNDGIVAPSLSVVLSFYNEENNIPELLRRLRATLQGERQKGTIRSYELVFVNDASVDGSEALLMREAAQEGDIRLVNMSRNFGVSACVMAGFAHGSGDLVVYMDSDLQDPPELIAEMLAAWHKAGDADVVNTVRLSRAGESRAKLAITRLGYSILRGVMNINFISDAGDFKLLSRRVVNHILDMKESLPFVRGVVYFVGFKQVSIHYHREARFAGDSKFMVIGPRVIHNFLFSALISFSSAPLVLSILLGAVAAVIALAVIIYALIQYVVLDHVTSGWTSTLVAILFMGACQLITTGINGLYINSIFVETKGRPRYIVRSMVGFDAAGGEAPQRPDGAV